MTARIYSHLRRYNRYQQSSHTPTIINYEGGLQVDFEHENILLHGGKVVLTAKEKGIFFLLAKNPLSTFSKSKIYEQVWFEEELDDGKTVTVHMKSLRAKLKESSRSPLFIQTVWGIGYQFIGVEVE